MERERVELRSSFLLCLMGKTVPFIDCNTTTIVTIIELHAKGGKARIKSYVHFNVVVCQKKTREISLSLSPSSNHILSGSTPLFLQDKRKI